MFEKDEKVCWKDPSLGWRFGLYMGGPSPIEIYVMEVQRHTLRSGQTGKATSVEPFFNGLVDPVRVETWKLIKFSEEYNYVI